MAEHVWSILCQRPLIDPSNNVISLFEVAEKLNIQVIRPEVVEEELRKARGEGKGLSARVRLHLVSWWVRSDYAQPEASATRVTVLSPTGQRLFEQTNSIELDKGTGQRLLIEFDRFLVSMLGVHWFVVEKPRRRSKKNPWEVVARIPFEVAVVPVED
jgi:hypothetical protein